MSIKVFIKSTLRKTAPWVLKYREEQRIKKEYKNRIGRELDLKDPKCFTEKLQWYKLYYTNDDMRRCVDKYEFKKYITEKLGSEYIASLITVWNSPEEVSIKDVPADKFVIKSNLQSDGKCIVLVKNKNDIDIDKVEKEIKEKWFDPKNLLTNSFCKAYHGAKPRVIVEEFVEEFEGCANDYKIFCFGGKPEFVYCAREHFKEDGQLGNSIISFFSLDWEQLDVGYGEHARNQPFEKPHHLEEMIEVAKKLSSDFPFVRVDFFDTEEKLYMAELTFYPGGGFVNYHPEEFDRKMGELFILPKKQ